MGVRIIYIHMYMRCGAYIPEETYAYTTQKRVTEDSGSQSKKTHVTLKSFVVLYPIHSTHVHLYVASLHSIYFYLSVVARILSSSVTSENNTDENMKISIGTEADRSSLSPYCFLSLSFSAFNERKQSCFHSTASVLISLFFFLS